MRPVAQLLTLAGVAFAVLGAPSALAHGSDPGACSIPTAVKKVRPDASGPPVRVSVGILLLDIVEIQDGREIFDADLLLRRRWRDARLSEASLGGSMEYCDPGLNDIWHPQVEFANRVGTVVGWERLEIDTDGNIRFEQRISGGFETPFELREFPHDSQDLVLRLGSAFFGEEDVILEVDEANTGRAGSSG